jgi:hypothetical protein
MADSIPEEQPMPLSQSSPLPPDIDVRRVEAADQILGSGDVALTKATRAGCTTSAIIAAERRGLKTLLVAPTRNILTKTVKETVERMGGSICDIPGHSLCKYVQEIYEKDDLMKQLPIPTRDCGDCSDYWTCPITEIERIEDFTTGTMTYAKLESVMLSSPNAAETIIQKLSDTDLVILDEAHILSIPTPPQVPFGRTLAVPQKYGSLRRVYDRFSILCNENREQATYVETMTETDPRHYTGFPVRIENRSTWHEQRRQWGELIDLAEHREDQGVSAPDILALRDMITIMSGRTATISYISGNGGSGMVVSANQGRDHYAIREFLTEVVPTAQVIFVSGTLIERRPCFFEEISGRKIATRIFPDLNNTTARMHIHPSTWRFDNFNGGIESIDRAAAEATKISEMSGDQPIYLLAMNTRSAILLNKRLKNYKNITVDYYRSPDSMGVSQDARICIAVGAAELPRHVYDPLAEGANDTERYLDSQQLRINAVDTASWQAWSRVKDPEGVVDSHVYCLGVRAETVSRIATWGTKRQVALKIERSGNLKAAVCCNEYLDRPKIVMEERTDLRPCRRKISDYIDAVVPIGDFIRERIKPYDSPYNNIGERVRNSAEDHLRLFDSAQTEEEFDETLLALNTLFVTRRDKCGLQNKQPNAKGKFGYNTCAPPEPIEKLIQKHLYGEETIALPPFDSNDICYFGALDFDDHDGKTPQSENVKKLTGFLKECELPCIVVKSGTNDSYHVFLSIVPTKTFTVYKFLKQLVSAAHLDGIKVERYPKQKSVKSKSGKIGYGNQIKLPLAFNWKANRRSKIVDPYSLKPVRCIEVTHAVRLREIPEFPVKAINHKRKPSTASSTSTPNTTSMPFSASTGPSYPSCYPSSDFRPCLKTIIESGAQLNGGKGHSLRVAIAAEALNCGLGEKETVDLFRRQTDFEEAVTTENIRYVWEQNYHRYSCETLREAASSFILKYCENCSLLK